MSEPVEEKLYASAPHQPGCYLMKDEKANVIYVGKAKDLKNRVTSYFQDPLRLPPKTATQMRLVRAIEYIVTNSEEEALILEANLIRNLQPRFNIDLKEGRRYAYIRVTHEPYPRFVVERKPPQEIRELKAKTKARSVELALQENPPLSTRVHAAAAKTKAEKLDASGQWFGPYTRAAQRQTALRVLEKVFKIRTCNPMPKHVCLKYHLGECTGPCEGKISQTEYQESVKNAASVLEGHVAPVIAQLEGQMTDAAKSENFEGALIIREQIKQLQGLGASQVVESTREFDADVFGESQNEKTTAVVVFPIEKGVIRARHQYTFDTVLTDALHDFLVQYYEDRDPPKTIIAPRALDGQAALEAYLGEKRGGPVEILIPQQGDKKRLIEMAQKNAEFALTNPLAAEVLELQRDLKLYLAPRVIECFDNSTLLGQQTVSAMVHFENGQPKKSEYRHYNIKTLAKGQQDDFASMKEAVFRRYKRLKDEEEKMPDLIVIDGGLGQLHAAMQALQEARVDVAILGLAKQNEEVYLPGRQEPVVLDRRKGSLKLLQRVRDEAHRFAIEFHRRKRGKAAFE